MKKPLAYLKETDAWSTVLFADPIATPLAQLLSHSPIHPNIVTIASVIPALLGAYFFWRGDPWSFLWGALMFQFSWILDCTDGKLARLTDKYSEFGGKLDLLIDHGRKLLALATLAWGTCKIWGHLWGVLTFSAVISHYLIHIFAHYTPPRITQRGIPQIRVEKRIIRRIGQIYTAFDEQFLMIFLGPLLSWLESHLPTYMIWGASFLYLVNIGMIKIKMKRV